MLSRSDDAYVEDFSFFEIRNVLTMSRRQSVTHTHSLKSCVVEWL